MFKVVDWNRIVDLWCRKRPPYQPSHHQFNSSIADVHQVRVGHLLLLLEPRPHPGAQHPLLLAKNPTTRCQRLIKMVKSLILK